MKTPREILSQRHSSAEPKLDAIRKAVVAEHVIAPKFANDRQTSASMVSILASKLWMELILPCRRFWLAAAAAWMVILTVVFFNDDSEPRVIQSAASPSSDTLVALKAQRQFMAQLLEPAAPSANSAKPSTPSPRSEQHRAVPLA